MASVSELDVLIVDDHEVMRALLTRALTAAGVISIRSAPNATEALTQLRGHPAHLILADQNMPGMSGLEFIAAVRADAVYGAPRIVMISGHGQRVLESAQRLGGIRGLKIAGILTKPFRRAELHAELTRLSTVA